MDFLQLYGMTEASPLVSSMLPGSTDYSSAGYAIPNTELKIADNELRTLGPNKVSPKKKKQAIYSIKYLPWKRRYVKWA